MPRPCLAARRWARRVGDRLLPAAGLLCGPGRVEWRRQGAAGQGGAAGGVSVYRFGFISLRLAGQHAAARGSASHTLFPAAYLLQRRATPRRLRDPSCSSAQAQGPASAGPQIPRDRGCRSVPAYRSWTGEQIVSFFGRRQLPGLAGAGVMGAIFKGGVVGSRGAVLRGSSRFVTWGYGQRCTVARPSPPAASQAPPACSGFLIPFATSTAPPAAESRTTPHTIVALKGSPEATLRGDAAAAAAPREILKRSRTTRKRESACPSLAVLSFCK